MTPPFRRRLTWRTVALLAAAALLLAWRTACNSAILFGPAPPLNDGATEVAPPITEPISEGTYRVRRVVDGDTILLADGRRVRLIGVNAPESVKPDSPIEKWGPEASTFTHEFLAGNQVRLQFDLERVDQYDRLLAYVWVGDRMLNEELLRAGLARATLHYRFSETMKRRFRAAQDEARQARRGIWSESSGADTPPQHRSTKPAKPRHSSATR